MIKLESDLFKGHLDFFLILRVLIMIKIFTQFHILNRVSLAFLSISPSVVYQRSACGYNIKQSVWNYQVAVVLVYIITFSKKGSQMLWLRWNEDDLRLNLPALGFWYSNHMIEIWSYYWVGSSQSSYGIIFIVSIQSWSQGDFVSFVFIYSLIFILLLFSGLYQSCLPHQSFN